MYNKIKKKQCEEEKNQIDLADRIFKEFYNYKDHLSGIELC